MSACTDGDAARFAARMAERFAFLRPDRIMDAAKRRPDHPDYDPRTLYIPPGWWVWGSWCACLLGGGKRSSCLNHDPRTL